MINYSPDLIQILQMFYQKTDAMCNYLSKMNEDRLQCKKGCSACCVDNLEVMGLEAAYIKNKYPEVLNEKPNKLGQCAFLDETGACRVYEARPFICRTHGLPLQWEIEENGQKSKVLDICELNETETPLSDLADNQIFDVNMFEEILIGLQLNADLGKMDRVKLREMFE